MLLQFDQDEQGNVTATTRPHSTDETIEALLPKGKKAMIRHLPLNAVLDSLDPIEAEWLPAQEYEQGIRLLYNGRTRDEIEAEAPWCAGYRGVEDAPPRPDMSAEVLARIQGFAKQWLWIRVARRYAQAQGGIAADPINYMYLTMAAHRLSRSLMFEPLPVKDINHEYITIATETKFHEIMDKFYDSWHSANMWARPKFKAVDAATTVADVVGVIESIGA